MPTCFCQMAQLAERLGAELPVDDMRCGLHLVHRRLPEPAVGMLLQISIQEKGVHGQQAVQGVGGVCRNIREAAPDLFRKRCPAQGIPSAPAYLFPPHLRAS